MSILTCKVIISGFFGAAPLAWVEKESPTKLAGKKKQKKMDTCLRCQRPSCFEIWVFFLNFELQKMPSRVKLPQNSVKRGGNGFCINELIQQTDDIIFAKYKKPKNISHLLLTDKKRITLCARRIMLKIHYRRKCRVCLNMGNLNRLSDRSGTPPPPLTR